MPFELNCVYYSWIFYEKNINFYFKFKLIDKLSAKLRRLMTVYRENLYYLQELQKQGYDKGLKPKSYIFDNKVWLNNKYIKTK